MSLRTVISSASFSLPMVVFAFLAWGAAQAWAETVVAIDVGSVEREIGEVHEPNVVAFDSASDGVYVSTGTLARVVMPADIARDAIVLEHPAYGAHLSMAQVAVVQRDEHARELTRHAIGASAPSLMDATTLRYEGIYPGIDDEYILSKDKLKHDWVLRHAPALHTEAAWYGFEVRLTLPAGATLTGDETHMQVVDAAGDVLFELPRAIAVDAENHTHIGRLRTLATTGANVLLAVEVDANWLSSAAYPLRIDPTIITVDGPTTIANAFPWNSTAPWVYQQTYAASQLQSTSGDIERIGFSHNGGFTKTWNTVRIYMGETSFDSFTRSNTFDQNFNVVSKTLVYDGPLTLSISSADYAMIDLDTPFGYTGQNTLVVQIELEASTGSGASVRRESGSGPVECYRLYNQSSSSATDATGSSTAFFLHARFEIFTGPPNPEIDTTSLPDGTEGFPYSEQMSVSSGTAPFTWSATGLPGALSIDPSTGEILGTPGAADVGSFSVTVTVTDDNSLTDDATFPLEIGPKVSIEPFTFSTATATGSITPVTPGTTGGVGPFIWSATGIPSGITIDPSTGEIGGTLLEGTEGVHSITVTATDTNSDSDTYDTTLEVNPPPQIFSVLMPRIIPGVEWGPYPLEHEGGTAPLSFSEVGLPPGLTLDATTGEISGMIEQGVITSTLNFDATVTDANGVTHTAVVTLTTQNISSGSSGCGNASTIGGGASWLPLAAILVLLTLLLARRHPSPLG